MMLSRASRAEGVGVATPSEDDAPATVEAPRPVDTSPTIEAPPTSAAFVAGDRAALTAVYRQWSSLVYSVALRSLNDVGAAEDVTQRVFTRAWSARDSFATAQTSLPAWLIGILRAELDRTREAHSETGLVGVPGGTATRKRETIDPADLADRLVVADEMSRSSDGPHQAIRLALAEGLTHTQIAERLKLPGGLVRSHLSGGLLELQKRLAVLHDAR